MSRKIIDLWWEDNNLHIELEDRTIVLKDAWVKSVSHNIDDENVIVETVKYDFEPITFYPNK